MAEFRSKYERRVNNRRRTDVTSNMSDGTFSLLYGIVLVFLFLSIVNVVLNYLSYMYCS